MAEVLRLLTINLRPNPQNEALYDKDTGESWAAFLASVREKGVMQPLVVDQDRVIVSGHRRYRAAVELDCDELPCIVEEYLSDDDKLRAVVEYNRYRDKTVSERMREAALLEAIETRKAAARMLAGAPLENLPEGQKGSTRDIVAATVGVSGRTYDKMKFIFDAAEKDPAGTAARLVARIDKGESSIDSVFKTLKSGDNKTWLDFNPKVYDYWFFGHTDSKYGQPHPGQIHPGIVENLLWHYTKEGDLVVDPFAGGGITIDICNAWGRRVLAYDIDPRREDIQKNDLGAGYPVECVGANLIILDPPYWNMVAEDYSDDGAASYDFSAFVDFLNHVAQATMGTLAVGGHAAFIIMKQHYRLPVGVPMIDWPHIWYTFFTQAGGTPVGRFYNMWPTSIWQPYHVTNAKLEKKILPIMGELCVFQKR